MREAYVVAVGMIPFGRHYDKGVKQLVGWALHNLFEASPVQKAELQAAWMANSGWG